MAQLIENEQHTNGQVVERLTIAPPNFQVAQYHLVGTAPLCIARFSTKSIFIMRDKQKAGSTAKGKTAKEARNFEQDCEDAKYVSTEGWNGIHAGAFRNGAIDACRAVGYKMTHAKLALFVVADGEDKDDHTPLVRIYGVEPEMWLAHTINATGVADLRARPLWPIGWEMNLTIRYDADMFTLGDVSNLIARVGVQVGVGEGRPYSKKSAGLGLGTFVIR